MFGRWLPFSLAALALGLAGCGGADGHPSQGDSAPTQLVAGDWTGTLKQKGLSPFRIAVHIEPSGDGRVAYTGIECGGTWSWGITLDSKPPIYEFTETISEGVGGACKGGGTVDFHPDPVSPSSVAHYDFRGGGVVSRGLLHRTDVAGLKPVFEEAGVTPP